MPEETSTLARYRFKTEILYNEAGKEICGAKTRVNGVPGVCQQTRINKDTGRCRMHNGNARRGLASPVLKTGKYSAYLPGDLQAKYEAARDDDTLLSMRDDIAMLEARQVEILSAMSGGGGQALWNNLSDTFARLQNGMRAQDPDATGRALSDLEALIDTGEAYGLLWREWMIVGEQKRKLMESERKRLQELEQNIPAERAHLLIGAVLETIRRNVKDQDTLNAIAKDIGELIAFQAR